MAGTLVVSVSLQRENQLRQIGHRGRHAVEIHSVCAGRCVAAKRAVPLEEVESHHIGPAVGARAAEPHRTEDAGDEGDVVVADVALGNLPFLEQPTDHVEAENVGLALLHGGGMLPQRFADSSLPRDGVLDTQAVRHLVEHRVAEEGIECDVPTLILRYQHVGDGHEDAVELGLHGVLQLQTPRAFLQLDRFVIGEIDGDSLGSGVRFTSVVDGVVRVQLGVGARHLLLVGVRHR